LALGSLHCIEMAVITSEINYPVGNDGDRPDRVSGFEIPSLLSRFDVHGVEVAVPATEVCHPPGQWLVKNAPCLLF